MMLWSCIVIFLWNTNDATTADAQLFLFQKKTLKTLFLIFAQKLLYIFFLSELQNLFVSFYCINFRKHNKNQQLVVLHTLVVPFSQFHRCRGWEVRKHHWIAERYHRAPYQRYQAGLYQERCCQTAEVTPRSVALGQTNMCCDSVSEIILCAVYWYSCNIVRFVSRVKKWIIVSNRWCLKFIESHSNTHSPDFWSDYSRFSRL